MNRRAKSRAGFTLVELLIGSTVAGFTLAAVLSAYIFIGRNLARLSSYQSLENESRRALGYLSRDLMLAQSVKTGTTPTDSAVTLVLPTGEVSYSFSSSTGLRRQTTFGTSPDLTFLRNDSCACTSFRFRYFTLNDATPNDQTSASVTAYVPYSIKQIQVGFVLESPTSWTAETRTRFEMASSRYVFRNRGAPDGT